MALFSGTGRADHEGTFVESQGSKASCPVRSPTSGTRTDPDAATSADENSDSSSVAELDA
jgi:hypothetical protein